MDIGVFQLLPRGRAATDREVVEQALWEVDFAERHGFESEGSGRENSRPWRETRDH